MLSCPDRCARSPQFSRLLIDILTERIKRPKRRPKKTTTTEPLTITEITRIGIRVQGLMDNGDPLPCNDRNCGCHNPDPRAKVRRWHSMKFEAAIERGAEGISAMKDRHGIFLKMAAHC